MTTSQFLGSRSRYVYSSDSGQDYILTVDDTLAALSTTLTPFDPQQPGTAIPAPRRFSPRGVYWQATAAGENLGARKFIIMGDVSDNRYARTTRESFAISGVAGVSTGRRGEQLTF